MGEELLISGVAEVEAAVNRVLAAERAAAEQVGECRREAQTLVEEGRLRAHRVLERAEERTARVHALSDRSLERRLAEIRAESASYSERPLVEESDLARVRDVVQRLAAEVSGAEQ